MELKYLKCDKIQTVEPIELKFATHYVSYFVMHCADFGEYRFNGMSTIAKGIILMPYRQYS